MQLNFSGKQMTVTMSDASGKVDLFRAFNDAELQRRLAELYPGKFSFGTQAGDRSVKLMIILDEEG